MKLTSKMVLVTTMIMSSLTFAQVEIGDKQFPEDGKVYRPGVDSGFDQYKAKSLYGSKKIVLTFDDGPDLVQTPKLLELLKKYNVKATFFMLTEKINDKTIPLIKRIAMEGHIVASHHEDHENNNTKTEAEYRSSLKNSIQKLSAIVESTDAPNKEIYYRFPYGAYGARSLPYNHLNVMKDVSQELFGDNCINFAFWDIDSLDWLKPMDDKDVISNIMANIEGGTAYNMVKGRFSGKSKKDKYTISHPIGGGVVLMHDIHSRTIDLMETLLKRLRDHGIQVVPLNEVEEYAYKGKECRLLTK